MKYEILVARECGKCELHTKFWGPSIGEVNRNCLVTMMLDRVPAGQRGCCSGSTLQTRGLLLRFPAMGCLLSRPADGMERVP